MILVLHKDGNPVLPKTGKKQPKVYIDQKNANIAIKNMIPSVGTYSHQITQEEYDKELNRFSVEKYVPVSVIVDIINDMSHELNQVEPHTFQKAILNMIKEI